MSETFVFRILLITNAKRTKTVKSAFAKNTARPASASLSSTIGNIDLKRTSLCLSIPNLPASENFTNATFSSQKIRSISWKCSTIATISFMETLTTAIRKIAFQIRVFRLNINAVEVTTSLSKWKNMDYLMIFKRIFQTFFWSSNNFLQPLDWTEQAPMLPRWWFRPSCWRWCFLLAFSSSNFMLSCIFRNNFCKIIANKTSFFKKKQNCILSFLSQKQDLEGYFEGTQRTRVLFAVFSGIMAPRRCFSKNKSTHEKSCLQWTAWLN